MKKLFFISIVVILISFFFAYVTGLRINLTESLPGRLWLIRKISENEQISVGDFVVVPPSEIKGARFFPPHIRRKYFRSGEMNFLKEVKGVPGDFIHVDVEVLSADSEGDWLIAYPNRKLNSDEYWLTSNKERGFDSRYFGPVNRRAIKAKASPLF